MAGLAQEAGRPAPDWEPRATAAARRAHQRLARATPTIGAPLPGHPYSNDPAWQHKQAVSEAPESLGYVIQNLKAVYGVPECEGGLDPLDVLPKLPQTSVSLGGFKSTPTLEVTFASAETNETGLQTD